jgi:hypothetical protein
MSRWTEDLPSYEALLERCTGLCRDEMLGEDYLEDGIRAVLAEVLRTLETVTPEMGQAYLLAPRQGSHEYYGSTYWLAMLRASSLTPPPKG